MMGGGILTRNKLEADGSECGPALRALPLFVFLATMIFISPCIAEIEINVTKEVVPEDLISCENAVIWINVSAAGEPYEVSAPICAMLVIDTSTSMTAVYNDKTILEYIKGASKTFIGNLNFSQDYAGIVSYGSTATLRRGLTNNSGLLNSTIDNLAVSGIQYTNLGEGIRLAQQELEAHCKDGYIPIIILFTDGVPTARPAGGSSGYTTCDTCPNTDNDCTNYARSQAENAKAANITIFSVGYLNGICGYSAGQCNPPNCYGVQNLATDILEKAATKEEYAYFAPTPQDLEEIYTTISQVINEIAATNLVLVDYLAPNIILLDGMGGSVQFTMNTLSINETWNNSINITTNVAGTDIPTNAPNSYLKYNLPDGTEVNRTLPVPTIDVSRPLTLEKSGPSEVVAGEDFNYTIELNHIGSLPVDNLTIEDELPDNVTYVTHYCEYTGSGSSNPLDVNYDSGSHRFTITTTGPLQSGDRIICNITVFVDEDCTESSIVNFVAAFYDRYPCIMDQTITETTEITVKRPNLSITKDANVLTAAIGDVIEYNITVTNTGEVKLFNVTVTDNLTDFYILISELDVGESNSTRLNYKVTENVICDNITNVAESNGSVPNVM